VQQVRDGFVLILYKAAQAGDGLFQVGDPVGEGVRGGLPVPEGGEVAQLIYGHTVSVADHDYIIKRGRFRFHGEEFVNRGNRYIPFHGHILKALSRTLGGVTEESHINERVRISGGKDDGVLIQYYIFVVGVCMIIR
jgi:hypothetical protein